MEDKVKINLGSGHWKLDDWVNVDIDRESQPDVCANLATGLLADPSCHEWVRIFRLPRSVRCTPKILSTN